MAETMMLGLRLTQEGVDCARFAARFGADPRDLYAPKSQTFTRRGLLEIVGDHLRLTPQRRLPRQRSHDGVRVNAKIVKTNFAITIRRTAFGEDCGNRSRCSACRCD